LAVYICKCGFPFERASEPDQCPDCGGKNVRYASEKEVEEYKQNRAEADRLYAKEQKGKSLVQ
jgi:predicted  nucleic acid-binding Zn-ribbon protein